MANNGTLNLNGVGISKVIARESKGKANMVAAFNVDLSSNVVTGTLVCTSNTVYAPDDGPFTASMLAFRTPFNKTNPTTYGSYLGRYSMVFDIPADAVENRNNPPKGRGFMAINVVSNGEVKVDKIILGDYATPTYKVPVLPEQGYWPFYAEAASPHRIQL